MCRWKSTEANEQKILPVWKSFCWPTYWQLRLQPRQNGVSCPSGSTWAHTLSSEITLLLLQRFHATHHAYLCTVHMTGQWGLLGSTVLHPLCIFNNFFKCFPRGEVLIFISLANKSPVCPLIRTKPLMRKKRAISSLVSVFQPLKPGIWDFHAWVSPFLDRLLPPKSAA